MNAVESRVRDVRARMRRSAALDAAVRWSLYGALLAGGWLAAAKLFGWPGAPGGAALALPALAGVAAALRRFDLRAAAAAIDRALGLEERVATALEGPPGPLGAAVSADAVRALDRSRTADVGRFQWPAEARFLVPALVLVALLAYAPIPGRSGEAADPALRAAVDRQVDRLSRVPVADAALKEKVKAILADLTSDDLERMAAGAVEARKLSVEIKTGLATGGAAREDLKALADRLEAAGAGASSELTKRGIEVPDVEPVDLEARAKAAAARGDLASSGGRPENREVTPVAAAKSIPVEVRQEIERRLTAKPLDLRYIGLVNRYYERYERMASNSR